MILSQDLVRILSGPLSIRFFQDPVDFKLGSCQDPLGNEICFHAFSFPKTLSPFTCNRRTCFQQMHMRTIYPEEGVQFKQIGMCNWTHYSLLTLNPEAVQIRKLIVVNVCLFLWIKQVSICLLCENPLLERSSLTCNHCTCIESVQSLSPHHV